MCGIIQLMKKAKHNQPLSEVVRAAIQDIAVGPDRGRDISLASAEQVMNGILLGEVDEVQAAVFLIALRMKRESMDEFAGLLAALKLHTKSSAASVSDLVCLAEPFDGYLRYQSMTPFIAPVLAACGLPALIHGVESVGPKHGVTAHQIFHAIGIDTFTTVDHAKMNIEQHGWAYLDQSVYNPRLNQLRELRNRIIKRSALTTLERLLCPIRASGHTSLALGYVHKAYPEIYSAMAKRVGFDSAVLFKGVEGGLAPALNKPIRRFICQAEESFLAPAKEIIEIDDLFKSNTAALPVGEDFLSLANHQRVEQILTTGLAVLQGEPGLARDSLCLAAGQLLFSRNKANSLSQAVEKVAQCLDNGSAQAKLMALR